MLYKIGIYLQDIKGSGQFKQYNSMTTDVIKKLIIKN